jgi:hypothetical protein
MAYRKYARMRHQHKYNTWGAKSDMMHNHAQPIHVNNMHYIHLILLYDFLQILNSARKH